MATSKQSGVSVLHRKVKKKRPNKHKKKISNLKKIKAL